MGYGLAEILVPAIITVCIWLYESYQRKRSTLYYPLFFACDGIIRVINDEYITSDERRNLFEESVKTLNKLIYEYGTIKYLGKKDLENFYTLFQKIEGKRSLFDKDNWEHYKKVCANDTKFKEYLNDELTKDAFIEIQKKAINLRELCKIKEKSLGNLDDSILQG